MNRIFLIILSIISFCHIHYAQTTIRITKTQIIVPQTINFGKIDSQKKYIKLFIRNERDNAINLKNIEAPKGFVVSINNKILKPKSQTIVYIGILPTLLTDTLIKEKIKIETNLILPIVLNVEAKKIKK